MLIPQEPLETGPPLAPQTHECVPLCSPSSGSEAPVSGEAWSRARRAAQIWARGAIRLVATAGGSNGPDAESEMPDWPEHDIVLEPIHSLVAA